MSTLDMREALYAIVEYAGPLDDPRIVGLARLQAAAQTWAELLR